MSENDLLFAVMMIDLDQFKPINDEHGHDVGDVVLQKISERLSAISSAHQSTCIRWGGDEFLVGIVNDKESELQAFGSSLLNSLQQSILVNEALSVQVGASIGIVFMEKFQSEFSVEDMIKQADELMYSIKQSGKNNFVIKSCCK